MNKKGRTRLLRRVPNAVGAREVFRSNEPRTPAGSVIDVDTDESRESEARAEGERENCDQGPPGPVSGCRF